MAEAQELVTYLNGRIVPYNQAVEALRADSLHASGGFYDNERTFNGQIFKLRPHLERLFRGLDFGSVDPGMALEEMESITLDVLEANRSLVGPGDEFIVTQVVSPDPARSPGEKPRVDIVVYCEPLDFATFATSYLRGVRLVTPTTYVVPGHDSPEGVKRDSRRVIQLMTGREGSITECTGGNFMFVKDSRIKLPDRRDVLPGISMQTVLELAESLTIGVDEDDYSAADVYVADEAFVTSTRYCMLPVASLNGYSLDELPPGPVTRKLLDAWRDTVGVDFVQQALDHLPAADKDRPPNRA